MLLPILEQLMATKAVKDLTVDDIAAIEKELSQTNETLKRCNDTPFSYADVDGMKHALDPSYIFWLRDRKDFILSRRIIDGKQVTFHRQQLCVTAQH